MPSRPAASRRASAQARTKQALLDAGRALLSRAGYRATSIDAIARTAGVTKGAFYANFDSKAALYRELLAAHFRDSEARFRAIADAREPEAMLAALEEYLTQTAQEADWGALAVELRAGETMGQPVARTGSMGVAEAEQLHEAERAAIALAIAQLFAAAGKCLPAPADALADAFIAMNKGFALRRRASPTPSADVTRREIQLLLLVVRSVLEAAPAA